MMNQQKNINFQIRNVEATRTPPASICSNNGHKYGLEKNIGKQSMENHDLLPMNFQNNMISFQHQPKTITGKSTTKLQSNAIPAKTMALDKGYINNQNVNNDIMKVNTFSIVPIHESECMGEKSFEVS